MKPQTKYVPIICQHGDCKRGVDCCYLHVYDLYEGYCAEHAKEYGMCWGCGNALIPEALYDDGQCPTCYEYTETKKR